MIDMRLVLPKLIAVMVLCICMGDVAGLITLSTIANPLASSLVRPFRSTDSLLPLRALPSAVSTCTDMINDWYLTYPYLSALMTCSCKAGVADYIVQSSTIPPEPSADNNINVRRNVGFIVYGGLYQGVFQQYMYGSVFPTYFDDSIPLVLSTLMQLVLDMALLGPCLCLPVAYFVQSMCTSSLLPPPSNDRKRHYTRREERFNLSPDGTTTLAVSGENPSTLTRFGTSATTVLRHAWEQYLHDVEHEHILIKYWSLWIPVKCLTFTLIPCHLRIVFIATISFFWMMILSNASSSSRHK